MKPDEMLERIAALEVELEQLKRASRAGASGDATSRRDVFKKLAVAGVGAAAGAALLPAGRAGAASTQPLIAGKINWATHLTRLRNGTEDSNLTLGPPLDAEPTMFWADNRASARDNANGIRGDGKGTAGAGVWGHSDFSGIGLLGTGGIGVQASGGRAAVQLVGSGPAPATRTDAHSIGELVHDENGNLWFCVAGGSPGSWRKLAGPATSGQLHLLAAPVRVYDSRTAVANGGPLAAGSQRSISLGSGTAGGGTATAVPTGSAGALISVTLDGTVGAGFVAVFAGGLAWPGNSNANWYTSGQILAVTTVTAVDPTAGVIVLAGGSGSTNFLVDVIGYYG